MAYIDIVNEPLYGSYRAFVEDVNDPLNLGRFKARIPSIHGTVENIPTENLPWVVYCSPGLSYNSGMILTPSIGDVVMVMFEGGNPKQPIYLGSILSKGSSNGKAFVEPEGVTDRYRESYTDDMPMEKTATSKLLYKSPKGSMILMEERDGEESITIKDYRGSMIVLSGGDITITSGAVIIESTVYVHGDIEVSGEIKSSSIDNTGTVKTMNINSNNINTSNLSSNNISSGTIRASSVYADNLKD